VATQEWLRDGDADDGMVLWMGLEKGTQQVATIHISEVLACIGMGYHHVQTFSSEAQADMWLAQVNASSRPGVEVTIVQYQDHPNPASTLGHGRTPICSCSSISQCSGRPDPEQCNDEAKSWYGLVEPSHACIICNTKVEHDELIEKVLEWQTTFQTLREAEEWMHHAPSPPPKSTSICHVSLSKQPIGSAVPNQGVSGIEGKWHPPTLATTTNPGLTNGVGSPDAQMMPQMAQGLSKICSNSVKFSGKDPSVGDYTHIYGIKYNDVGLMEKALCSPGLDPTECLEFVE
jgi:hypothetical protein